MNTIDYNKILNRKSIFDNIKIILTDIISSDDISLKRGIYLHGNPGIGKTSKISARK